MPDRFWYAKHPGARAVKDRRYREKHRDELHARKAAMYAADPEPAKARARLRYAIKRDEIRTAARGKNDLWRANNLVRRSRKTAAFVERVIPLAVLEMADGVCGICGEDVNPAAFHVDHIVPLGVGGEHSYMNTQPTHPVCNLRKPKKGDPF